MFVKGTVLSSSRYKGQSPIQNDRSNPISDQG